MMPFARSITIRDKYGPVMEITTKEDAAAYFERCVEHSMMFGHSRADAETIERQNIGYYAGYYDAVTSARVHELFDCVHPIFGKQTPTAEEAFEAWQKMAEKGQP